VRNKRAAENTNELIILDALCGDKHHLPEDDIFYAKLFGNEFDSLRLISSPTVGRRLEETALPGVSFEETRFHGSGNAYVHHGLLYIYRMLFCGRLSAGSLIFLPAFYEIALILFKIFRARNIPVYAMLHNNLGAVKGNSFKKKIKKYLLYRAISCLEGLFVFTDYAKKELMSFYPTFDESRIHVVPLYMAGVERQSSQPRKARTLLFMGMATSEKGLNKLWELINSDHSVKEYDFVVKGQFVLDEKACELVNRNPERLSIKQGYVGTMEYYETLSSCSFVVLPYENSYVGKLSGIFCDAISTSTPVIAPKYPPFTSYFKRFGDLGILIDFDSPGWVSELSAQITNSENGNYAASFERAKAFHSESAVRDSMLRVFRSN
jgi:hypothetical protein